MHDLKEHDDIYIYCRLALGKRMSEETALLRKEYETQYAAVQPGKHVAQRYVCNWLGYHSPSRRICEGT